MSCPVLALSTTQPQVLVYTGTLCSGTSGVIYPGTSNIIPATLGVNTVKSIRVPGNVTVRASTVSGQTANLVGGTYTDITSQLGGALKELAVSAPTKPWDQFLSDCCAGVGSADVCGGYTPGSSTCAGLASSSGCANDVSDPKCRAICLTTPGACDVAARQWCASHPTDPFCRCLMSTDANPWCTDGTCILSGYKPSASLGKTGANCPSYVDCKQNQTANDSSSQWFNLQLAFCNGVDANGLYQILMLILVVAIGGYLIYWALGDDTPIQSQYGYYPQYAYYQ